jgi:hypothetical protein
MATAGTIVNDALKEIGVLAEGETPTASMADDALRALNRIMESLSNYQAFAYTPSLVSKALTSQTSFTVGPTGDVVVDRPIAVESAFVDRSNLTYPVRVVNNQQWDSIVYKTSTGSNTEVIWYEPTVPNGIVHVWPKCTGCTLNLRVINLVVSFATLATTVSLPPGYEEALIKNLAVNIAPQYPACNLSPLTIQQAKNSLKIITRTNNAIPTLSLDPILMGNRRSNNLAAILGGY